jgi:hypothetical protein
MIGELSVESQQQSLLRPKLVRPNHMSIRRSTLPDKCLTVELKNSSYDESTSSKRAEIILKSAEQSDLINTYFDESRILSK